MDREGITKSEEEVRDELEKSEEMVKELERQRDSKLDSAISLSNLTYHKGKVRGLKLALAIILSNQYSVELNDLRKEDN